MEKILEVCKIREQRILRCIVFGAFVAALGYSLAFRIQPTVDARAYDNIAWQIASGGGYDTESSIGRPGPAYEFFLALLYVLFGHSYPAVWVAQSLLHALTAFLVFRIARLVFAERFHPVMGLAAAALVGFSPDLLMMPAMLMTETLTIFFMTAAVYMFFLYRAGRGLHQLVLMGILLALGALTRSNLVLLLMPFMLFFVGVKEWRRGVLFLSVFGLCLAPWTIRNYLVYREFLPFNAAVGALLAIGNHPGASGELESNFVWPPGYDELSQIEFDRAAKRDALAFIRSNPFEFLKITLVRASVYFSIVRPTGFWLHLQGAAKAATLAASFVYGLALFFLGGVGVACSLRRKIFDVGHAPWHLFLMFIMMPLAIVTIIVETRYRYPAYPLLAAFAGYAVFVCMKRLSGVRRASLVVAAFLAVNGVFDVARNWSRIADRIKDLL